MYLCVCVRITDQCRSTFVIKTLFLTRFALKGGGVDQTPHCV